MIVVGAILLSYWALFSFVPVPGTGVTSFAEGANGANYIDQQYLPGRRWDGEWDPEGLLLALAFVRFLHRRKILLKV